MQIQVLGPIAIAGAAVVEPSLSTSLRQLLAVLVASGERGLPQDSIAEELWGDDLPASWESAFRNGITRLRKELGKETLSMTSGRYHLDPQAVAVDAWQLLDQAAERSFDERDLARFLPGTPFLNIELSPTIRFMADQVEVGRSTMIRVLTSRASLRLEPSSLALLRAHQRQHNIDNELLELVVRAHLHADEANRALSILSEARANAADEGHVLGARLLALEEAIRQQSSPGALLARFEAENASNYLPQELSFALDIEQIGRRSELLDLLDGVAIAGSVLLTGQSGTGKTRLVASAADQLAAAGYEVRYATGQGNVDTAYGPLLSAVPEASAEVRRALAASTAPTVTQGLCHAALLNALEGHRSVKTCLIIDDGHLLDSHSDRFVRLLAEQSHPSIALIITARSDWTDDGWQPLRRSLKAAGSPEIHINALNRYELIELARSIHPHARSRLLAQLADEVLATSGGLPGVARYLMRRADPHNLLVSTDDRVRPDAAGVFRSQTKQFTTAMRTVATAAAVLGHTFDLAELRSLVDPNPGDTEPGDTGIGDTDIESTRAVCQQLIAEEFIRETYAPDRYSFIHALHRDAMLDIAPAFELRRLHHKAAGVVGNKKRQARHYAAAVPLVDESVAVHALVEASLLYFAEGAWRECASALRDAHRRTPDALSVDDLCRFGAALDLSGADGSLLREGAFESAASSGDWSTALQVATSGLQAAERVHGDSRRVALLERIPLEALDGHERFTLASTLVRQRLFLGPESEALRWCEVADSEASTPDERLMAFVNRALAAPDSDPLEPLVVPRDFDAVSSEVTKLRGLQVSVLSHLERSAADDVEPLLAQLAQLTESANDAYRTWHHLVLTDALTLVSGAMDAAGDMAQRTLQFGQKHGIGDAEGAYLAFVFFAHVIRDEVKLLRPDLDRFASAGHSLVHRLMTAVIENSGQGANPTAAKEVEVVALDCVDSRSMFALPTLVLGARHIGEAASGDVRVRIYQRLQPRTGTSAVVANGVVHAGPVDRALAFYSTDGQQRQAHLETAVAVADRQRTLLWQIVCRLELGTERHLDEVRALASTPDLQSLIDEHNSD